MKSISNLEEDVNLWNKLFSQAKDIHELAQMGDENMRTELENELNILETELARRQFDVLLGGKYDRGDALLTINAGAGGTDSQDWAAILMRMYLRWIERKGYSVVRLFLV